MSSALAQHPLVLKLAQQKDLLFPIAFISLIAVILVPLPPFCLDLLLGREHHALDHHSLDDHLREEPAGVRGTPVAPAGDHPFPARGSTWRRRG